MLQFFKSRRCRVIYKYWQQIYIRMFPIINRQARISCGYWRNFSTNPFSESIIKYIFVLLTYQDSL